jgi:UDP-N-acetyl-D-glucosamine dehydrogenase
VDSIAVDGVEIPRVELTRRAVAEADCVAVLTPHSVYDLEWIADHAAAVFDGRNAFGPAERPNVVRL